MKLLMNKKFTQKIIIAIIFVILFNFSVPVEAKAFSWGDLGSKLLKELINLVITLGDIVMGLLNKVMLGAKDMDSAILVYDSNIISSNEFTNPAGASGGEITVTAEFEDNWWGGTNPGLKRLKIPNFMYSPEAIFGNKIAMLDINFINPDSNSNNFYKLGEHLDNSGTDKEILKVEGEEEIESPAKVLSGNIAKWYKSLRNIAIVGLLIVLLYIGIRILIGSTAQDKAKYKERLQDWLVALVLVFVIHFIMAGVLYICSQVTNVLSSTNNEFVVHVVNEKEEEEEEPGLLTDESGESEGESDGADTEGGDDDDYYTGSDKNFSFKTNLMGYVRFMTQINGVLDCGAYAMMYVALVIYTVMFTFTYLKRVLYMAFFTMIAPLVALTYPIDKMGDGKAQAFNLWLKEYTMNAILQPVHLLLYAVIVSSAIALARQNPLYAIVALAFLTPAEKFIKKMFGLDKASSPATLGSMAAGGLALSGVGKVVGAFKGGKSSGNKQSNGDSSSGESSLTGRGASVRYNSNPYDVLAEAGSAIAGSGGTAGGNTEGGTTAVNVINPATGTVTEAGGTASGTAGGVMFDANTGRYLQQNENEESNNKNEIVDSDGRPLRVQENPVDDATINDKDLDEIKAEMATKKMNLENPNSQEYRKYEGFRSNFIRKNPGVRIGNKAGDDVREEEIKNDYLKNEERKKMKEILDRKKLAFQTPDSARVLGRTGNVTVQGGTSTSKIKGEAEKIQLQGGASISKVKGGTEKIQLQGGTSTPKIEKEPRNPQTKLGRGLSAAGALTRAKLKNKWDSLPGTTMKVAKSTAKGGLKTAAKVGGAALGAAAGAALVGGAAIASGEGAGKILAAGALTGMGKGVSVGGNSANRVIDKASKEYGEYKEAIQGATTPPDVRKKARQEKFDKEFKGNADNYRYLLSKGMTSKQAKDFLQNRTQQFLDAGIDDIKLMHNAIRYQENMKKKGVDIDDKTLVATTQIAKKLPANFQENKELKKSYAEDMMRGRPRITEKIAYSALDGAEKIRFPSN